MELLRILLAGKRPQARAGAPTQDDGLEQCGSDAELDHGFLKLLQDSGDPSAFAKEFLVTPVCDKPCVVVCPRALPHLAHLLGKSFSPGEPAREVAAGSRLEQQAVAAGLDEVRERALPAGDHG